MALASTILLPAAIPGLGVDFEFWILTAFVLLAWFVFRWDMVKGISRRGARIEIALGLLLIAADYAFNMIRSSTIGIIDIVVIFIGTIVVFYGFKAVRLFWVPAAYGVILLLGYQIENLTPNFVSLQVWLAGILTAILNAFGISSTVAGQSVSMSTPNGAAILLRVGGPCTGVQGIVAFGMLSTMTLLDFRPRPARLIPIFAIGFAGAFLVNILRLLLMFLTYEFTSLDVAETLHIYVGYFTFIVWVVVFWAIAFKFFAHFSGQTAVRQPQRIPNTHAVGKVHEE